MANSPTTSPPQNQEDDEDDYMGDLSKFIQTDPTPQPSSKPARKNPPKTLINQPQPKKPKPNISWLHQKKLQKERKQQEEDQKTLENLNSAIPQSNIGFKLLKQMGYTPGSGLGKEGNSGRVDPVGVEIRRGRAGIGREDPVKERARKEKEKEERKRKSEEELLEEFGVRQKLQWRCKRVVGSFWKAKAVLDQLDNKEVVVEEKVESGGEEGSEEEEEVITEEDLLEILVKLREEHQYCLFCGCQYESAEALLTNCPGINEDDH